VLEFMLLVLWYVSITSVRFGRIALFVDVE